MRDGRLYDVIVVGGGPAGSTAARECAARGLSAIILDKARFPRDKPCGGGVTLRAASLLPFDLSPITERTVHGVRFRIGRRELVRHTAQPLVHLTQRSRLDAFLLEQAVAAGAELEEGTAVQGIQSSSGRVVARTERGAVTGRALVAADGVNGVVSRMAGLAGHRWLMVALEGNALPAGSVPVEWQDAIELDIGQVRGGYGWVFPKGDHLNFGVGGELGAGPTLRRDLERLLVAHGLSLDALQGLRGYRLPVRRRGAPVAKGNVLLAGDAAGLVEPFTGEGIYGAIVSGILAAHHLQGYLEGRAKDLSGYQRELRERLGDDLRMAGAARNVFHRAPNFWMWVFDRLPAAWTAVVRILRGEQDFLETRDKLGMLGPVFDVLAFLARFAPDAAPS